jgi:hypothetical protein
LPPATSFFRQFVSSDPAELGRLLEAAANGSAADRRKLQEGLVQFVSSAISSKWSVSKPLVQGAVKLWEGKLQAGVLEITAGAVDIITPSLQKRGASDSLILALKNGNVGWVKIEGNAATFSVDNLPEVIQKYLLATGLDTIAVEMNDGFSGMKSVELSFAAGPAEIVDGITVEGGTTVAVKFERTGRPRAVGTDWKVQVKVGGTLAIGTGSTTLPLALSATYAHDKTATPSNQFTIAGACGEAGAASCVADMMGVQGFGISHVSMSSSLAYEKRAINFSSLDFEGGMRLGAHTQTFSGNFVRDDKDANKKWLMTFLVPALEPSKFVEFARRVGRHVGPSWLAELPEPPRGQLGFAFTNVVGSTRPMWTPCSSCAARDLKPGFTISASSLSLPSAMVDSFGSLEFLKNVRGSAYGALAVGFAGADVGNSRVSLDIDSPMDLGALTITKMSAHFTGGSLAPEVGGTLGVRLVLPKPVEATINVPDITMSYGIATKEFKLSTSFSVNFEGADRTFGFEMVKSPLEKSLTCTIPGTVTQSIAKVTLSDAFLQYRKERGSETARWDEASWAMGMTAKPDIDGFPALAATFEYNSDCKTGILSAAQDPFEVWGVLVQDATFEVSQCKSSGTTFSIGGRLTINGASLTTMTMGASDAIIAPIIGQTVWTNNYRAKVVKGLGDSIGKMPDTTFDLTVSYASSAITIEIGVPLDTDGNRKIVQDLLGGMEIAEKDLVGASVNVKLLPSIPDVQVAIELPSMAMTTKGANPIHFTELSISVEGMLPQKGSPIPNPIITGRWGFWVQFKDTDNNCCSALGEPDADGLRAILPNQDWDTVGYNPMALFDIGVTFRPISGSLSLYGTMRSHDWFEDFLGISQLGVKTLGVAITMNPFTSSVTAFGLGATACLYKGTPQVRDDVENNQVIGGELAGRLSADPTDNCFYFSTTTGFMFSKVLNYVLNTNINVPKIFDVRVNHAMFAFSTALVATRCMGVGDAMTAGIKWHLDAEWLGFAVVYKMAFVKSASRIPNFEFFLSITNEGFTTTLQSTITSKFNALKNFFVDTCARLGGVMHQICKGLAFLVTKIFNIFMGIIFNVFVFHHLKVNVPNLSALFTGGDWPSFALKFEILGVTIDINIDLGKLAGALAGMLLNALNQVGAFLVKLKQGLTDWLGGIVSRVRITTNSKAAWPCSCNQWPMYYKDVASLRCVVCGRVPARRLGEKGFKFGGEQDQGKRVDEENRRLLTAGRRRRRRRCGWICQQAQKVAAAAKKVAAAAGFRACKSCRSRLGGACESRNTCQNIAFGIDFSIS